MGKLKTESPCRAITKARKKKPRPKNPRHKQGRTKKGESLFRFFPDIGDLTEQDLRSFDWICRHIVSLGYPPSVSELCKARGIKSKRAGYDLLARLEAYGFLDVDPQVTRGIRVHNLPPPEEQGVARLKLWLSEAAGHLRKQCPGNSEVEKFLRKISVIAF